MVEEQYSFLSPAAQEETVVVQQEHNLLCINLREHSWVSVSTRDGEILSEHNSEPVVEFTLSPGTYTLRTDGVIEDTLSKAYPNDSVILEQFQPQPSFLLNLTSDASDRHVVDGIGEIPADGQSSCTIAIEKVFLDEVSQTNRGDDDEIFLRTTGGTIMDSAGEKRIRSIRLEAGRGEFRLVSETSPKVVTVSALCRQPPLSNAEIQVEFI